MRSLTNGRNCEIELLRFLFACGVMLGHFQILYGLSWFSNGGIGVEYFFLLSGLLMAKSSKKFGKENIGRESWQFIKVKIAVFYPYYLAAMLIQLFLRSIQGEYNSIFVGKQLLTAIPQFLLGEITGANISTVVAISGRWYLSAMIFAMAILFPLLLRFGDYASKILFPLLAYLGLGFLQSNYGSIVRNYDWNGFIENGLIRAVAEISLGVVCYQISDWIAKKNWTNLGKADSEFEFSRPNGMWIGL